MAATSALAGVAVAAEPVRCLLRALRPAVLGRALVTAALCALCFPMLILVLAWHSMGLKDVGVTAGMPIILSLSFGYALYGLHFGLVTPLLNSFIAQLPEFEESLAPVAEPVVRRVLAWMPAAPEASLAFGKFREKVDETVVGCFATPEGGMVAWRRLAHQFILERSVVAFRDALLHDLVQELKARGETRVTMGLLKTHVSKHIAAMTAEKLQARLESVRTIHLDITLLIFAIPLGVAIYRLA